MNGTEDTYLDEKPAPRVSYPLALTVQYEPARVGAGFAVINLGGFTVGKEPLHPASAGDVDRLDLEEAAAARLERVTGEAAVAAVHMDAADFGRLCKDYETRDPGTLARGRFWAGPGREVDGEWEWKLVYWFGENYAALLLARAYALSLGFRCEVLYDNSSYRGDGPARGWCILSDYEEQR